MAAAAPAAHFVARQTLRGAVPAHGDDVAFLLSHQGDAVVQRGGTGIGSTVNEIRVLNNRIHDVVSHGGRVGQRKYSHMLLACGLTLLAAAIIAVAMYLAFSPTPPARCATDADCGADAVCVGAAPPLSSSSSSSSSPLAKTGVCSRPRACQSDAQCGGGGSVCLSGLCQPAACTTSADCLRGGSLRVDPVTGETVAGAPVFCDGGKCQLGCDEDGQCGGGPSAVCNTATHTCVRGGCHTDVDCATVQRCGRMPPPSTASPQELATYAACAAATVCGSDHTCHVPCQSQADCGDVRTSGTVCQDGACTALACSSQADCRSNDMVCNMDTKECQPSCLAVPALCGDGETCDATTQLCVPSASQ